MHSKNFPKMHFEVINNLKWDTLGRYQAGILDSGRGGGLIAPLLAIVGGCDKKAHAYNYHVFQLYQIKMILF